MKQQEVKPISKGKLYVGAAIVVTVGMGVIKVLALVINKTVEAFLDGGA
jgi:hypothetical protein